jgi:hypothetical protein
MICLSVTEHAVIGESVAHSDAEGKLLLANRVNLDAFYHRSQ